MNNRGQTRIGDWNVYLIGFSGSGKSAIGRQLARRMRRKHVDMDDEIVARTGSPIPEIFRREGEPGFRSREKELLEEISGQKRLIVSTGGGAPLDPGNRAAMARSGVIVCLEAKPDFLYGRLKRHLGDESKGQVRPLLEGDDPKKRIEALKEYRQRFYATADWTVHTDDLTVDEVVGEVIRGVRYAQRRFGRRKEAGSVFPPEGSRGRESEAPYCRDMGASFVVETPGGRYPVFVGWGTLSELGQRLRNLGLSGKAALISDAGVYEIHGVKALESLRSAGFEAASYAVPAGERSKSEDALTRIYDWMVEQRLERGSTVVALGGGVAGDLAGYAAATFLRGVPLVHAPTSLLAMTDSAIGGKVAINHPRAKNLIGAFYQPRLVLSDVETLTTLPARELASGWAETIKHGMIMDPDMLDVLEGDLEKVLALDPEMTTEIVKRSAGLKGKVVSGDEKEAGWRMILNFGHTIGHALEAATEYGTLLHGEAVSIGAVGAARLSREHAGLGDEVVDRLTGLLKRFGLPTSMPDLDADRLIEAMFLDKKVRGKAIRWVLLEDIGKPVIRDDIPMESVREVLAGLAEGEKT